MKSRCFETAVEHAPAVWLKRPNNTAVDVGCGVGLFFQDNTRLVVAHGTDLLRVEGTAASLHFIAVALKYTLSAGVANTNAVHLVSFRNALGEVTKLDSDFINRFCYSLSHANFTNMLLKQLFKMTFCALKSDSVFTFFDQDVRSRPMQKIPPVIFTLINSLELFIHQFYSINVKELQDLRFVIVSIFQTDP